MCDTHNTTRQMKIKFKDLTCQCWTCHTKCYPRVIVSHLINSIIMLICLIHTKSNAQCKLYHGASTNEKDWSKGVFMISNEKNSKIQTSNCHSKPRLRNKTYSHYQNKGYKNMRYGSFSHVKKTQNVSFQAKKTQQLKAQISWHCTPAVNTHCQQGGTFATWTILQRP